jgi:GNAT superfamily N-acetyltransferase
MSYVGIGSQEHLQPRQFGPGGKYTSRPIDLFGKPATGNPKYAKGIEAVHTNSGRRLGYLDWHEGDDTMDRHVQGSADPQKAAIGKVYVSPNQRKKGVASALLDHARDLRPGLQHSGPQALTEDGAAWARRRP